MKIYLNGFSAITKEGLFSSTTGHMPFDQDETQLTFSRKKVYKKLHTGFGKLNPPDKLAFSVASLILDNLTDLDTENTAISLGTVTGSFSTDVRYMESVADGYPSPAYFQATLPSSPVAEVAILFKLKGPDRAFVSRMGAGIEAINGAQRLLLKKKATSVLVLFINGIDTVDLNNNLICNYNISDPFAFALLLSANKMEQSFEFNISNRKDDNKSEKCEDEVAYFLKLINDLYSSQSFNKEITVNKNTTNILIKKEI